MSLVVVVWQNDLPISADGRPQDVYPKWVRQTMSLNADHSSVNSSKVEKRRFKHKGTKKLNYRAYSCAQTRPPGPS